MKFYFCESCGVRLTEEDIKAGLGKDKKLKGVYCEECAAGVLTMENLPATDIKKSVKPVRKRESGLMGAKGSGSRRRSRSSAVQIPVPVSAGDHDGHSGAAGLQKDSSGRQAVATAGVGELKSRTGGSERKIKRAASSRPSRRSNSAAAIVHRAPTSSHRMSALKAAARSRSSNTTDDGNSFILKIVSATALTVLFLFALTHKSSDPVGPVARVSKADPAPERMDARPRSTVFGAPRRGAEQVEDSLEGNGLQENQDEPEPGVSFARRSNDIPPSLEENFGESGESEPEAEGNVEGPEELGNVKTPQTPESLTDGATLPAVEANVTAPPKPMDAFLFNSQLDLIIEAVCDDSEETLDDALKTLQQKVVLEDRIKALAELGRAIPKAGAVDEKRKKILTACIGKHLTLVSKAGEQRVLLKGLGSRFAGGKRALTLNVQQINGEIRVVVYSELYFGTWRKLFGNMLSTKTEDGLARVISGLSGGRLHEAREVLEQLKGNLLAEFFTRRLEQLEEVSLEDLATATWTRINARGTKDLTEETLVARLEELVRFKKEFSSTKLFVEKKASFEKIQEWLAARQATEKKNTVRTLIAKKSTGLTVVSNKKVTSSTIPKGLVGYWNLDELSGGRRDSSRQGNTLSDPRKVLGARGIKGGAAVFDGRGYLVKGGQQLKSFNISSAFTVSAWLFTKEHKSGKTIVGWYKHKGPNAQSGGFVFSTWNGRLKLSVPGKLNARHHVSMKSSLPTGKWVNVTGVFDGTQGKLKLYVDGKLVNEASTPESSVYKTTAAFMIGGFGNVGAVRDRFVGLIDEVSLFNRALTVEEIASTLALQKSRK